MKAYLDFELESLDELRTFLDVLYTFQRDRTVILPVPEKNITPDQKAIELHPASIKQLYKPRKLHHSPIQTELKKCENPECGNKTDKKYCSKKCGAKVYMQKYWKTHEKGPNGKVRLKEKNSLVTEENVKEESVDSQSNDEGGGGNSSCKYRETQVFEGATEKKTTG